MGLYLLFVSVVYVWGEEEKGRRRRKEGADLSLKSNNPTLKGGEKAYIKQKV